jgi:hypothetical protein
LFSGCSAVVQRLFGGCSAGVIFQPEFPFPTAALFRFSQASMI